MKKARERLRSFNYGRVAINNNMVKIRKKIPDNTAKFFILCFACTKLF